VQVGSLCLRIHTHTHSRTHTKCINKQTLLASHVWLVQIKNFSEAKDGQAPKDQGPAATQQAIDKITAQLPQVVPHALAKLEKPDDEMYTVGGYKALGEGSAALLSCQVAAWLFSPSHVVSRQLVDGGGEGGESNGSATRLCLGARMQRQRLSM